MDWLDSNWLAAQMERVVDASIGSTSVLTSVDDQEKARKYVQDVKQHLNNLADQTISKAG